MALQRIDAVYLYSDTGVDSVAAKKYLDDNKITYIELCYWDPAQHPLVFAPLRTWWPGVFDLSEFPFVVYTEVDDRITDPGMYTKKFIAGLAAIEDGTLLSLAQIGK